MSSRGQQAVWSVLAMLTFWCVINSVKINKTIDEQQEVSGVVQNLADKYEQQQRKAREVKRIQERSFGNAFGKAREVQGEGGIFTWRGEEYTTDYAEEIR